jgi:hypothetical protein
MKTKGPKQDSQNMLRLHTWGRKAQVSLQTASYCCVSVIFHETLFQSINIYSISNQNRVLELLGISRLAHVVLWSNGLETGKPQRSNQDVYLSLPLSPSSPRMFIISLNINLFSPWYSWTIALLAFVIVTNFVVLFD